MFRISKKARRIIVLIVGNAGAPLFAISTFMLVGRKNPILGFVLSCIAGTLGYLIFTGLATLAMRFVGRRVWGRAKKPVYALGKLPQAADPFAGGKGRTLARLYQAGYRVPDGFVILCTAFAGDELRAEVWPLVAQQLARLRRADRDCAFAVRSSALSEDAAQTSFAGEFETVLDVKTDADIREAIHAVRRSRHNARVQAYAQAQGLAESEQEIAVVIQCLIRPDFAGVLFTADPLTGGLAQMTGNYVEGLGEKLVSGQANPHTFTLSRPAGAYDGPSALKPIARALHDNACNLEDDLGGPQDIEWAVVGKRLYLLQSRPITTLRGYDPATGEWNDTRTGNFLWSATNLSEACPETMTPFTASLRLYIDQRGGPTLKAKGYSLYGVIGGRLYANLSVQISAFNQSFMNKGDSHRFYHELLAGWWGEIPETMEIPIIPLTKQEWSSKMLPQLLKSTVTMWADRKRATAFITGNRRWCAKTRRKIQQIADGAALAAFGETEILPRYRDAIAFIAAASVDAQVRLEREMREMVSAEDANALLSNLSGLSGRLESLGPVVGLSQVIRGEISREEYLDAYGHRGMNETECAWPRPLEDPAWLDRQIAESGKATMDFEARFAERQAAYRAAWERFCVQHPQKIKTIRRRLQQTAQGAQRREAVRSESVRVTSAVRAFALRAGELSGLGEDVFFLTIDETLDDLRSNRAARQFISVRKDTYQKYHPLPPYPTIICGRFDPLKWAADPNRRSDIYAADAPAPRSPSDGVIQGFPGAMGVVEGTVRRLDRLEDSDQMQPGEILVTSMTNIGWTPLFPRAAAIVTDLGAPLSHAAIVARELGIPAVVGCNDATMRLKTGDRVRVNGGQGIVEILSNGAD